MANWGYTVSKDQQIDFDSADKSLYQKVLISEPSFSGCIACGSCAATCSTVAIGGGFSLRKTNILLSRGQLSDIKKEITQCMLCGKCTLVCPRGVNTRNLIVSLKSLIN